jgi:Predicted ATP-dependent endonuclease of the OLD family
MRLTHAQVTNFRSVDDSTEFSLGDVTCLVGKNESGKTTILQAIEKLNPVAGKGRSYSKLKDYPRRHWSDYDDRHPDGEARVLSTRWSLEPADVAAVEAVLGKGVITSNAFTVTKDYESVASTWIVPVNETKATQNLAAEAGVGSQEGHPISALADLHALLKGLGERSPQQDAVLKKINEFRDQNILLTAIDILSKRMPKFLYFSSYSLMNGDISIERIVEDRAKKEPVEGDELFAQFLEYSGTSLEDLRDSTQFEELRARIEAASNKITEKVFEYWSQNQYLSVEVSVDTGRSGDPAPYNKGTVVRARIRNQLHKVTVPFSDRSTGFVWFFSFLVAFAQVKKLHGNVIILLDEPGHGLHGRAQADLLRFIAEKLQPQHQVIYTTHSPFMVPADNLAAVRIVEDRIEERPARPPVVHGTKVSEEFLSRDNDTVFPLQAALGYEITQTLFVGKNTVLLEGPSDILYLQAASAALKTRKASGLDPKWTLCPSGGVDKVWPFVSLFLGQKLNIAVLTDFSQTIKKNLDKLKGSKLLDEDRILAATDFVSKQEADIEDLFEPPTWASVVNGAYGLKGKNAVTAKMFEYQPDKRVLEVTEQHFKLLPDSIPMFDHFTPAAWLIQHPEVFEPTDAAASATLDRFQKIFDRLAAFAN